MVLFVHRPEYYHIYDDGKGNDLCGRAQIIIAKHRKGATGDVLLDFQGKYTRFSNPDEFSDSLPQPNAGGEIVGSKMNDGIDDQAALPLPPSDGLCNY